MATLIAGTCTPPSITRTSYRYRPVASHTHLGVSQVLPMRAWIVIALAALACLSAVQSAESDIQQVDSTGCKSQTQAVANCSVALSVCYGFFQWHWKYTATASVDGKTGSSGHDDSGDGAAEDAIVDLFANKLGEGDCSCTASTLPAGKCPITFSVCFMFNNTGALQNKQPSFNAWAHNTLTGHEGSVHQYSDPKQAAINALTDLFMTNPSDQTLCYPKASLFESELEEMADHVAVPGLE